MWKCSYVLILVDNTAINSTMLKNMNAIIMTLECLVSNIFETTCSITH